MKKILLTGCGVWLLTVMMASCSMMKNQHTETEAGSAISQEASAASVKKTQVRETEKLLLGEWTVSRVGDQEVTGDERPYVIFDTTSVNGNTVKVMANNGCNTLNGSVVVTPGGEMKKTQTFATTMRLCPNAPYERGINIALETVGSFKIEKTGDDYVLSLMNESGQVTMTMMKSNISFMNGGWAVVKIGNTAVSEDKGLRLVIDIPELKLHGNGGCNVINGKIFIDPAKENSIQFTDLITTMMYCPDIQLEQSLLVALEQVETAVSEDKGQTAVLKDDSGKTVIVLKHIELKQ